MHARGAGVRGRARAWGAHARARPRTPRTPRTRAHTLRARSARTPHYAALRGTVWRFADLSREPGSWAF